MLPLILHNLNTLDDKKINNTQLNLSKPNLRDLKAFFFINNFVWSNDI